jgi:hypothetical protein
MPAAVWMTLRLVDRVEPPTDNLALGRLNPDRLLGVDHPVTVDHVRSGGLCQAAWTSGLTKLRE